MSILYLLLFVVLLFGTWTLMACFGFLITGIIYALIGKIIGR